MYVCRRQGRRDRQGWFERPRLGMNEAHSNECDASTSETKRAKGTTGKCRLMYVCMYVRVRRQDDRAVINLWNENKVTKLL